MTPVNNFEEKEVYVMHKAKKFPISFELVITVIIAACMLFLNYFTTNKLTELENSSNEAMFVRSDLPFMDSDEFTEEVLKYKPGACKMIELYNEDFEMMLMIRFDQNYAADPNDSIVNYPDLINTLQSSQEGQVKVGKVDDTHEEYILFQWLTNTEGERRLIMVYNIRPVVDNLWVFTLISCLVIVMVFVLLIRLYLKEYKSSVTQCRWMNDAIRDRVNN